MNENQLRSQVESMINQAWTEPGFCVPNLSVYPHQWLWDSCFHSLVLAELGDGRAVVELESALHHQHENGFVPHMTYWSQPDLHEDFWGREMTSSITQPPMYGHAAAELHRKGFHLEELTIQRIENAFRYLLKTRSRTVNGLVPIFHPWESGCDDSPRWDLHTEPARAFDVEAWRQAKAKMVESLVYDAGGAPIANPSFEVGSIGFNALLAFNFDEFVTIAEVGERPGMVELRPQVEQVRQSIIGSWSDERKTWVDDGDRLGAASRTADAMLGLLIDPRAEAFEQLRSAEAFASPFGVSGVHRDELSFDASTYWRGPIWPQLNYLLGIACRRWGEVDLASIMSRAAVRGARRSGFAEYWNPETGDGLGAIPQTWAGLAIVRT